jgi:hypothetical protein
VAGDGGESSRIAVRRGGLQLTDRQPANALHRSWDVHRRQRFGWTRHKSVRRRDNRRPNCQSRGYEQDYFTHAFLPCLTDAANGPGPLGGASRVRRGRR